MEPSSLQPLFDLIKGMQESNATLGILGAVSALVYGLVRIYRLQIVQDVVPKWAKWNGWSTTVKMCVLFGTAFLAQLLAGIAAGTKWTGALIPAAMAGFGAIGLRQVEKNVTGDGQTPKP